MAWAVAACLLGLLITLVVFVSLPRYEKRVAADGLCGGMETDKSVTYRFPGGDWTSPDHTKSMTMERYKPYLVGAAIALLFGLFSLILGPGWWRLAGLPAIGLDASAAVYVLDWAFAPLLMGSSICM